MVVIEDVSERVGAVAERLPTVFTAVFDVEDDFVSLSPSIGVIEAAPQETKTGLLIRRTDAAMYQAKAAGKDRWVYAPA